MKNTIIILVFWSILVAAIYIFGFWNGPTCAPAFDNSTYSDNKNNVKEVENAPWFEKYTEFYPKRNLSSLVLLHVLMRHGDRTNIEECQYPQDPYLKVTYAPYTFGELTNLGKRRMYEVGRLLRHEYNDFLQDYKPDDVDAISSEKTRCKASLALVLAGLYPPSNEFTWMNGFNWQPIAFRSLMGKDNVRNHPLEKLIHSLLGNPRANCDNWNKYYEESTQLFQDVMTNYSDYFERLENFTGWKKDLLSVNLLYHSITTNLEWGLELDDKLKQFWPEPTITLNKIFFQAWSETDNTKKAGAGLLLDKILEDTTGIVMSTSHSKVHLYSGSDFTLISFLRILGQNIFDNPPFGAHVIVELHKSLDGKPPEFYFKFFYRSNIDQPTIELKIPDCNASLLIGEAGNLCSFDNFLMSRLKYFPTPNDC